MKRYYRCTCQWKALLRKMVIIRFSEEAILKNAASKKLSSFHLNYFSDKREDVLFSIQSAVMQQTFSFDTSSVIKVILGEDCTFKDLVDVFNICLSHDINTYAWVKDSVFIFSRRPPEPSNIRWVTCGYSSSEYSDASLKSPPLLKFLGYVKENFLLLGGYLVLFALGAILFAKDLKSKTIKKQRNSIPRTINKGTFTFAYRKN
jgi:hypothetical protein